MPGAMKTRSKKASSKSNEAETADSSSTVRQLQTSVSTPPQVFILPKGTSESARILTLTNPATSDLTRYSFCPQKGFYEFTRVAAPKRACRSWLLAQESQSTSDDADLNVQQEGGDGYVLQSPDMMVATPLDPLFLLLPALSGHDLYTDASNRKEQEYLSCSDYLERLADSSEHFKEILRSESRYELEAVLDVRMQAVCDAMDAGDERLYTLSKPKLLAEMITKAKKMVDRGLPASMEERFVKRELVVPVLGVKREESGISVVEHEDPNDAGADSQAQSEPTSQDSQSSSTMFSSSSTAATSVTSTPAREESVSNDRVAHLLRLRTALNFILGSYFPKNLRRSMETLLNDSPDVLDFGPLEKHLAHIAEVRKEAAALRSMSDNISRKRSAMEGEEALEKADAKKRKKEEEEIKRKNTSRGVQQLKKADTSGMKKLSAFFAAKPAAKKT